MAQIRPDIVLEGDSGSRYSGFIRNLHPAQQKVEMWEERIFGHTAAPLINLVLFKIRNGKGPVFELTMREVEDALHLKRRQQQSAIDKLIVFGVITKLKGGARNRRQFRFNSTVYEHIKPRTQGHEALPFENKFDELDTVLEKEVMESLNG